MARNFVAKQWKKQKIMCIAPDVCLTQVGNVVVPLPYVISQTFNKAKKVSRNVRFNNKKPLIFSSNSASVKGDTMGAVKGGILSGTKGKKATPFKSFVNNVKVNNKLLLRVGDLMKMNNGNTIGKIKGSEKGNATKIKDNGDISGETSSHDYQQNANLPSPPINPMEAKKQATQEWMQYAHQAWLYLAQELPEKESAIADKKAWFTFYQEFTQSPMQALRTQLQPHYMEDSGLMSVAILSQAADDMPFYSPPSIKRPRFSTAAAKKWKMGEITNDD